LLDSLTIFMYHRFRHDRDAGAAVAAGALDAQLSWLGRFCEFVTLDAASDPARPRRGLRPRVSVTIDDGYRSIREVAAPVFARHGVRPSVFLPWEFVEHRRWLWQDRYKVLVGATSRSEVRLPTPAGEARFALGSPPERIASLMGIHDLARGLSTQGRDELAGELAARLEVDLPEEPTGEFAPLTWDQIRELQTAGWVFGSHTLTHPLLTDLDEEAVAHELVESRRLLEERLDCEVRGLAYPNGRHDAGVRRLAAAAGYRWALATRFDTDRRDPFAQGRISPPPRGGRFTLLKQVLRNR
jgi:peptidoglycan/xylan/chitin deacetylase (PgdA/CDA1 family)